MIDLLTFGRRLRHARRRRGLTLDELGGMVGKPAPYLSNLENGKREPKLGLVSDLAEALGSTASDLLDPSPPTRRDALEIGLERAQAEPLYQELGLPHLKPGAKLPDTALEHLMALYGELKERANVPAASPQEALAANSALRDYLTAHDLYLEPIERVAADALDAVGADQPGAMPQSLLSDLVAHFGFEIRQVPDLPMSVRALADLRHHRILIRGRDEMRTRRARTVVLQTLGHFVLGHGAPTSYTEFLRQRMEANYFAAAVLAPERTLVPRLLEAKAERRISVEEIKELYYINYRLAAQRFTNLATRHLDVHTHFVRSDELGAIWKAYGNSGVPFPTGPDGSIVGQRLCRQWGTRLAFRSDDKYGIHYQYTDTGAGTFWCATHLEVDREPPHAITVGTTFNDARYFLGSDTDRHSVSNCPDGECCRRPPGDLVARWSELAWPSARASVLNPLGLPSGNLPGVDLTEVFEFLDSQAP
ncbi:MAG: helix-turn-helix domain-containing protein [Acidimicrobiia bacterium]|nr:helix-turn-helix domain-containing protein [Acidimicrobiia bacterium]